MSLPPLHSFAATCKDKGKRPNQEDYVLLTPSRGVCLCDGMGGHSDGEKASHMVTAAFLYEIGWQKALHFEEDGYCGELPPFRIREASPATIKQQLCAAFHAANDELRKAKEAGAVGADAGCTLIAAYICGDRVFFVSVGDSLIYLYRKEDGLRLCNELYLDTKERELRAMKVPEDEIRRHPQRNALVRAVVGKHVSPHIFPEEGLKLRPGDCIVLASDGILPLVESDSGKKELSRILSSPRDDSAEKIVQAVLRKNSPKQDNVSVILIGYKALSGRDEGIPHHSFPEQHGISIESYSPSAYRRKSIVRSIAIFITCLLIFSLGICCAYFFLTGQQETEEVIASPGAADAALSQNAGEGNTPKKDKNEEPGVVTEPENGNEETKAPQDNNVETAEPEDGNSERRGENEEQTSGLGDCLADGGKDGESGSTPAMSADSDEDGGKKTVEEVSEVETPIKADSQEEREKNETPDINSPGGSINPEKVQEPNVSEKSPTADDVKGGGADPAPTEREEGNEGNGSVKWEKVLSDGQYASEIAKELNSLKSKTKQESEKLPDKFKVSNCDKYYQGIKTYIAQKEKDPVKTMVLYAMLTKNGERQKAFEKELSTIENIVKSKKNDKYPSLKKYVLDKIGADKKVIQENTKK